MKILNDDEIKEIIKLYKSGISSEKIAKQFDCNGTTICRKLKKNGIKIRPSTENKRKYKINLQFIDNITTEEQAYFLGFMWADGNVHKNLRECKLALAEKDREILEKFSDIIYGFDNIKTYINDEGKFYCVLGIYSIEFVQKLVNLGCTPNKTFTTTFPDWLSPNLYPHFIRGVNDGDGCIYIRKKRALIDITGTPELLISIAEIFKKNFNNPIICFYKRHKDRKNNNISFRINAMEPVKEILDWLYKDSKIKLLRKYKKYLNVVELFEEYSKIYYTRDEKQQMVDLHDLGVSINKIGKLLNINDGVVYKIIQKKKRAAT